MQAQLLVPPQLSLSAVKIFTDGIIGKPYELSINKIIYQKYLELCAFEEYDTYIKKYGNNIRIKCDLYN